MPNERTHQFLDLTTDELKAALIENAYRKDNESRRWFSRFKFAYDAVNGNPHIALGQGLDLLNKCRWLDEKAYAEIHKGGAFYWLGIASFLVNEFEMATFFFDAAVSEDLRAGHSVSNPSPAMRFTRIDGEHPDQAARPLVEAAQKGIERWITHYNSLPDNIANQMTTQILRERLFIPSILPEHKTWRSLTTAFISFCLEWDYRNMLFDIRVEPGTFEPFYVHLFKGCVLFESLLKENPTKRPPVEQNTLRKVLVFLHKPLGIGSEIDFSNKKLSDVISELDKSKETNERSIWFTGMVRNTLGHSLGWDDGLTKYQYQRLFQMIAGSCIHALASLYKIADKTEEI